MHSHMSHQKGSKYPTTRAPGNFSTRKTMISQQDVKCVLERCKPRNRPARCSRFWGLHMASTSRPRKERQNLSNQLQDYINVSESRYYPSRPVAHDRIRWNIDEFLCVTIGSTQFDDYRRAHNSKVNQWYIWSMIIYYTIIRRRNYDFLGNKYKDFVSSKV